MLVARCLLDPKSDIPNHNHLLFDYEDEDEDDLIKLGLKFTVRFLTPDTRHLKP
jgi:hypothetical protein